MNAARADEMPHRVQDGIDRFGELVEEYKRMKGVHGDQFRLASYDLYTGILADAFHWARMAGIDFTLAFGEAYKTCIQEASSD